MDVDVTLRSVATVVGSTVVGSGSVVGATVVGSTVVGSGSVVGSTVVGSASVVSSVAGVLPAGSITP